MTPAIVAVVTVTILATSFLSGVFGMAGGMILLGVLLLYLDVAPAMVLFGVIQMSANGWRAVLWHRHMRPEIVWRYLLAGTAAFVLMRWVAFVPDKAMLYVALGAMPIVANLLPKSFAPDITRPWGPYSCGFIVVFLQLMAGAAGNILDLYFQLSGLDRRAIVATKAVCQTAAHLFRIVYFGSLANALDLPLPWWGYIIAVALALIGTSLAALVLKRMSNDSFRAWSRRIVLTVSATFLARGLWLAVYG